MSFFQSDVVRAEMAELSELQEEIYNNVFKFPTMSKEDQENHIDILEKLLEKQRNFMFRLSLEEEDADAIEMKKQIVESAKFLGLKDGQNINAFFDTLSATLDKLEKNIPD